MSQIISLKKKQLHVGEFKMEQKCLQVSKGKKQYAVKCQYVWIY